MHIEWVGKYAVAARLLSGDCYIPITHTDNDEDIEVGDVWLPSHADVEKEVIFRESLRMLSKEAKQVVKIVLDAPSEIAELIVTSQNKELSTASMSRFLIGYYNWPHGKVQRVFKEIREMLKELET